MVLTKKIYIHNRKRNFKKYKNTLSPISYEKWFKVFHEILRISSFEYGDEKY